MAERLITDSSLARATAASFFRSQAQSWRENELSLRSEGLFDAADMARQFADRLERGELPTDQEWIDRGRTTALLQLVEPFPRELTFYTEAGEALTVEEAMRLGGWVPKQRTGVPHG